MVALNWLRVCHESHLRIEQSDQLLLRQFSKDHKLAVKMLSTKEITPFCTGQDTNINIVFLGKPFQNKHTTSMLVSYFFPVFIWGEKKSLF